MNQIVITKEPICIVRLMEELSQHDCCGALVWFAGIVRNENDGKPVNQIYYECYEPMAKKELEKIVQEKAVRAFEDVKNGRYTKSTLPTMLEHCPWGASV